MSKPNHGFSRDRKWRRGHVPVLAGGAFALLLASLVACKGGDPSGTPELGAPVPSTLPLAAMLGATVEDTVTFANTGGATLTFETGVEPAAAGDWLSVTPASGSVAPGGSGLLTVTAQCPLTAGALEAFVTIDSNDPQTPSRSVEVLLECAEPRPATLECEEIDEGAAGPTLRCVGDRTVVRVPWQGSAVRVDSLPLEGLGFLPAQGGGFAPLSTWPLLHFGVVDAATEQPVVDFDPPLWLSVEYDADDFEAATPLVDEGELGLGVWDTSQEDWIVAGHGVFHHGFWVADPIGGDTLVLEPSPGDLQPRFQLTGTPAGGHAVALIAQAPSTLPVSLGAMPFDEEHMVMEFDAGCTDITLDGVAAVECVSEMAGVTVRVPVQEEGTVTPLVLALPWNKASTFLPSETPTEDITELERRLMNFLVVDADDPTRVLSEFDPSIEFEVRYTPQDRDPDNTTILRVNYWDEFVEQFVVLGEGNTDNCLGSPGCPWGGVVEAEPTDDPAFDFAFYLEDETGGVAKFKYHLWGDRMIAFAR